VNAAAIAATAIAAAAIETKTPRARAPAIAAINGTPVQQTAASASTRSQPSRRGPFRSIAVAPASGTGGVNPPASGDVIDVAGKQAAGEFEDRGDPFIGYAIEDRPVLSSAGHEAAPP